MASDTNQNSSSPPSEPEHKIKFWNDPGKRALIFQVLLVLVLGGFVWFIVSNTLNNLEQRGITTGFDFLSQEAGFGIPLSLVEYTEASSYGRTFIVGLLNTVLVSVLGIIAATILGFILGVARLSDNWLISRLSALYIEIFRNIPLLLQIFFWYFAVLRALPSPRDSIEFLGSFLNIRGLSMPAPVTEPGFNLVWIALAVGIVGTFVMTKWAHKRQDATGKIFPVGWTSLGLIIGLPLLVFLLSGAPMTLDYPELRGFNFRGGMTIIPEFVALWLALTIYTAAFIAETVRGGILSVPHGQLEAASALGLPKTRTLRLIVIPQAMRVIIPPLTNQYLNLTKNSSLATAIGYPDLVSVFAGTTLNQTGQAIEVISMTMAVYLSLSVLTSIFMNWYNKRKSLIER
ncbi:amino acid ABC transporter permease [Marinobacterium lutimaris]|uniref:Amino acid ABC transporter membrane protein 1, PAAT family n=1 Tax=Marinobacterium lutimaris TaxID=568106 RepID=A0A1H6DBX3_9GAMM|nr:amino acid ABC transporter permease [Marinobacterium lutimaris]SEG82664.1 amino acid ABC transporter membrane protein 1, PAAT family [Marinobacterium lutimaris]